MEVQNNREKFNVLGVQIKIISFARPESLTEYQKHFQWKFDIYSDPERKLYHSFGMKQISALNVFHPRTLLKYAQYALEGKKIEKTKEDIYQIGGDVLLDANGKVRYRFCSQRPDDRPSIETLLTEIKKFLPSNS